MNAKDVPGLNTCDLVLIVLNDKKYFNPYEGTREVAILSESDMLKKLQIPEGFSKEFDGDIFKENHIMSFRTLVGRYVGDREDIIKIQPFYGMLDREMEYFTIRFSDIKIATKLEPAK